MISEHLQRQLFTNIQAFHEFNCLIYLYISSTLTSVKKLKVDVQVFNAKYTCMFLYLSIAMNIGWKILSDSELISLNSEISDF